jgi:hypothetical protein
MCHLITRNNEHVAAHFPTDAFQAIQATTRSANGNNMFHELQLENPSKFNLTHDSKQKWMPVRDFIDLPVREREQFYLKAYPLTYRKPNEMSEDREGDAEVLSKVTGVLRNDIENKIAWEELNKIFTSALMNPRGTPSVGEWAPSVASGLNRYKY